ncbi:pfEMP1, partial [Plasmodium falciparum HB3]
MGPPGITGTEDLSAKHMFDRIGAEVQKEAHKDALARSYNDLQGFISRASYKGINTNAKNACELDHNYESSVTTGHSDPCENRWDIRFSDIYEGQCTNKKIKGNDNDEVGACAPYRRLHVCDRNLEEIKPVDITNANFLVDVLLAAKHEGQSIKTEYNEKNGDYKSGLCTVLARSFADIGDIIRGKDLYLGNKKQNQTDREKERLQQNLKEIFKKIHEKLEQPAKERYEGDEANNFFKLREDWWNANRQQIWKAITCNVPEDAKYLEKKDGRAYGCTHTSCHCAVGDVLTNFDYVPQYLRWFDEWTEEFCRLRRKKIEILEKICRGKNDSGQPKYCSRNGCDCEQTINKIGRIRLGNGCTNCLFACNRYIDWINNKKKEFLKQKKKYDKVINRTYSQETGLSNNIINKYDNKFYKELRNQYGSLQNFLQLLNKEKECLEKPHVEGNIKHINFSNANDTFYRSKYCESCPECGVVFKNGQFIEREEDGRCIKEERDRTKEPKITFIDFLLNEEEGNDIVKKLKPFCGHTVSKKYEEIEKWKCSHYEDTDNDCEMQKNGKDNKKHYKIMPFVVFVEFWVTHMLKDSIDWRKYINRCINNTTSNKCKKGCKNNCECFKKWIKKKQVEWNDIKAHYKYETGFNGWDRYGTLELFLEEDFFEDIKKAYGNEEAVDRIKKLKKDHASNKEEDPSTAKYAIDLLLEHELDEADLCLDTHLEDEDCSDDDDDHQEQPIVKSNPCGGQNGRKYPVLANKAAQLMHHKAKTQLTSRAGGRSALKGDASKGTYKKNRKPQELSNICNITLQHSNDDRSHGEPCKGKDGGQDGVRMKIGKDWENVKENVKTSYKEVYLPPRREHMCTSNLENLDFDSVIKNDKASHSLLGDVLLSAKMDAQKIKDLYQQQNGKSELTDPNYQETVCRAIRYSFADLGDIIKGTDLWEANPGEKNTQRRLETVFGKIKRHLMGKDKDKYKDDDYKHTKLRSDWWEANRHQVWRAMKCAIENDKDMKCNGIPIEDYIPQRLRWMTEWAEWFCKMQSQEYENLVTNCAGCMNKNKNGGKGCTQGDNDCTTCDKQCKEYGEKIKKWKDQWTKMDEIYQFLYLQARTVRDRTAFDNPNDQQVVEFFKELQKEIKNSDSKRPKRSAPGVTALTPNTDVYSTAAGYIHQELPNVGCNTQTEFCKNGACMPPRRQSLCIHDLKELTKNSSKEQLREAFIKCAAIETHFLWIYYKNKNSSIVDTQLQNGNIPDEFKRIMYYTFGDYRDICLGTDISSDSNIKGISQK